MKEWWRHPSYKVFAVDTDYTETPSVRVTMRDARTDAFIDIYWIDGTCPQSCGETEERHD